MTYLTLPVRLSEPLYQAWNCVEVALRAIHGNHLVNLALARISISYTLILPLAPEAQDIARARTEEDATPASGNRARWLEARGVEEVVGRGYFDRGSWKIWCCGSDVSWMGILELLTGLIDLRDGLLGRFVYYY